MQKKIIMLWIVAMPFISKAQVKEQAKIMRDTVVLEEVTVSTTLPLNNNRIVDFFRTNHFATLDDINARLEGMSLIKRGAYAMEPQLHGFSGGQLNVTIDGMKMFGACTDKMDPITSYIEPTNLKTITINHGTNGCSMGCTIGGSVDMTLQEPNTKNVTPFYSSLGVGYESVSKSRNVLVTSGYRWNKWALGMDGVYRKNENYRSGDNRIIPFSQFQKINLHSILKYTPDSFQSFKADLLYDDARNVGYPALPMDVAVARASLFALEYQRTGKTQLKAKMYVNTIYHVMDDSKRDSLYVLKNKPTGKSDTVYMRMDMPGESSTLGAYLQAIIPLNDKNKLTLKADNYTNSSIAEMTMHMRYAGYSPELPMYMQTWPKMLRNVSGLYVQNSTFFTQGLALVINGRIDYSMDVLQSDYGQEQFSVFNYSLPRKQSKIVKSFNLSSQYQFFKSLSMTATIGYSERMPTIGERLGFYLYNAYDGFDYIGNPYILPEKSNFVRIAFQFSKPTIKINFSQSFSYVADYIIGVIDTLITPMNFYAKGIRVYHNIPSVKMYSADLQVLYNPFESWSFFLLTKYILGNLYTGEPLPLISPLKSILSVKYEKNGFTVQAENETSLAQDRININYGERKTPAFTLFSLKGGYTFSVSKAVLDVSLGVTNLLNCTYYEHLDWGRIYRPGRSFDLYVKFSF